jgi:hypothetical protein
VVARGGVLRVGAERSGSDVVDDEVADPIPEHAAGEPDAERPAHRRPDPPYRLVVEEFLAEPPEVARESVGVVGPVVPFGFRAPLAAPTTRDVRIEDVEPFLGERTGQRVERPPVPREPVDAGHRRVGGSAPLRVVYFEALDGQEAVASFRVYRGVGHRPSIPGPRHNACVGPTRKELPHLREYSPWLSLPGRWADEYG